MLVDINLLPEKEKDRSTLVIASVIMLSAAVLISLVLFVVTQSIAKQSGNLENHKASLIRDQEIITATIQISEFATEKYALEATVAWAEQYEYDTVPLLAHLVRLLPDRGFFDSFQFTGPNHANLIVQFNTTSEAAYYLTRLQAADFITEVSLESINAQDLDIEDSENKVERVQPMPRYLAVYSIEFYDERIVVEETEDPNELKDPLEGGDKDE